jgi:transposase
VLTDNAPQITVQSKVENTPYKTMAQLCAQFELHPNQISEWKKQLVEGAANVFGGNAESAEPVDLVPLHAKIGQLALENDFLERAGALAGLLSAKA